MFLGLCVFSREQEGDEDWGRVSGAGGRDREGLTQSWVISRKRRLCPVGRVGVYGSGCLGRAWKGIVIVAREGAVQDSKLIRTCDAAILLSHAP